MRDLTSARLMALKAVLFVAVGVLAGGLLILQSPAWKTVALLAAAIWAFARAYYFAFYVIEKYIDPSFRFAGLWSVTRYFLTRGDRRRAE